VKEKRNETRKRPLASWADIAQPAILATTSGKQRFLITIKLPERSLKSASSFVTETNDALKSKKGIAPFVLVDSERARLQRATASFSTFKEADACLSCLADLGLKTGQVSAELEDFGNKQYDPWHESISRAWWPWLAAWRNPPPEMPMAKVANRLSLTEGSKYAEGPAGKLGKSEDADRSRAEAEAQAEEDPQIDEEPRERKPRRKKE